MTVFENYLHFLEWYEKCRWEAYVELIKDLARRLGISEADIFEYIYTMLLSTEWMRAELKAIPVIKQYIRERYSIDFDKYLGAVFLKVEGLPWDFEFHIPEAALILAEVGVHGSNEIDKKNKLAKFIFKHYPRARIDWNESRTSSKFIEYPEVLWIHVDSTKNIVDREVVIYKREKPFQ